MKLPWYKTGWGALGTALVLPPAGLVLQWMRPIKLVHKIAGSLPIAIWFVAWLVSFFGLRFQMDGSGMRPVWSFYSPERHYARIERTRAEQAAPLLTPAAPAATSLTAPPASGASPSAAPPAADTRAAVPAPSTALWTGFRGASRDGVYTETPILTAWPELGLKMLWQQPVGGGYASIAVAQGRAYTIEQRRRAEVVAAYDLATGRQVWTNSWDGEFKESMGGDGPRATPTWHDGRIYALGALGEFRCIDAASGRTLWRKNILEDNGAPNLQWGMAASPLIVDDKVIVLPGGPSGKSVAAYNRLTGEPVWKALDDKQAYAAPLLATLAGMRQIVVVSALRAVGLDPADGRLLWEFPWRTEYDVNAGVPVVVGPSRLFLSAGYGHGSAVLELSPAGGSFQVKTVWSNNRMTNKFSPSVLRDGYLYGLDEAILACISAETGELKWKGGRYGYGQVLLAGEHLVVVTEDGEVALVKASPAAHQEVAKFPALSGKTWNVPAIAAGILLVRNTTDLAAFRLAP
jgi:outer membrane protein assembly factor BamB